MVVLCAASLWEISCCSMNASNGSSYQGPNVASIMCPVSLLGHHFTAQKLKEQPQPLSKQNRPRVNNQQDNQPRHKDSASDALVSDRKSKTCRKTCRWIFLNTHMWTHDMAMFKPKRMSSAQKQLLMSIGNLCSHWN